MAEGVPSKTVDFTHLIKGLCAKVAALFCNENARPNAIGQPALLFVGGRFCHRICKAQVHLDVHHNESQS
jgi:hypothetical protein